MLKKEHSFYIGDSSLHIGVSRSLGDQECKMRWPNGVISTPEVKEFGEIEDGDILILACDGLWDVMYNEDVRGWATQFMQKTDRFRELNYPEIPERRNIAERPDDFISDGNNNLLKYVARSLRDKAYILGSRDNISVLAIRFNIQRSLQAKECSLL